MDINTAREKIAEKLSSGESFEGWADVLDDATPGNYGVNDAEVNIGVDNIWVDMRAKTFTFKDAEFVFNVRLGGSSDESGYDESFRKPVSGYGEFEYTKNNTDIEIVKFSINEHLDLYE